MIGTWLDRSIVLSILPLLIAIPVAVGLLIFLSHKLQRLPRKPISRTTGVLPAVDDVDSISRA